MAPEALEGGALRCCHGNGRGLVGPGASQSLQGSAMAGSERCRRARATWEVSESEPEPEPEPHGSSAAPEVSSPAAAAVRPKRRRAAGEAEARRRERQRRKEREALEKREAAAAWRLLRPERCLRLLEVCVDPGGLRGLAGRAEGSPVLLLPAERLSARPAPLTRLLVGLHRAGLWRSSSAVSISTDKAALFLMSGLIVISPQVSLKIPAQIFGSRL